jgi:AhpD family alkylhydroperoxidase
MALTLKEKELVAVGISVAAGCKPCTNYHVREVRKAEATDQEIRRAIEEAVQVRSNATQVMEAHGLRHLGVSKEVGDRAGSREATRMAELASIGAAFAVNCTSNLEKHMKASKRVGISEEEMQEVATLAAFIKKMGASHVEKLIGLADAVEAAPAQERPARGCC